MREISHNDRSRKIACKCERSNDAVPLTSLPERFGCEDLVNFVGLLEKTLFAVVTQASLKRFAIGFSTVWPQILTHQCAILVAQRNQPWNHNRSIEERICGIISLH